MAFIQFSTQDYPASQRLEAAQDIYAAIANIEVALPREMTPSINTRIRLLPGVSIALIESSPLTVHRRARQIQDGNDDFALMLNPAGKSAWCSNLAGVGDVKCQPGMGCFGFNDRPGRIDLPGHQSRMLNITFSRALFAPLEKNLQRSGKAPYLSRESQSHLVRLAQTLTTESSITGSEILQATQQLFDLAALGVGAPREVEMLARQRGLKAARLRAVKADLSLNAWRGDVSLAWVAKRHGVSPGYVRAMFEQQEESFTDYLLERRLQRALRRLQQADTTGQTVVDIAYESGFNNPSWFYRAFKRRFGISPREARELPTDALPSSRLSAGNSE